uniref:Chaperone protein DnaJ 1, mitochondrial isoform X1 n=1 Tax=Tanacetum cinerariifolium TaxID=118510 RepID=A0A6L2M583_TANCI|nr:chaperone protein DnaJ 1, mitochondrial isoform X1 [Tanacetum cinerariifolium]
MRMEDFASWVKEHKHMGVLGKGDTGGFEHDIHVSWDLEYSSFQDVFSAAVLSIYFMEAARGCSKDISFFAKSRCGSCDGHGCAWEVCTNCKGATKMKSDFGSRSKVPVEHAEDQGESRYSRRLMLQYRRTLAISDKQVPNGVSRIELMIKQASWVIIIQELIKEQRNRKQKKMGIDPLKNLMLYIKKG